jgi:hypothetical protein
MSRVVMYSRSIYLAPPSPTVGDELGLYIDSISLKHMHLLLGEILGARDPFAHGCREDIGRAPTVS